MATILIVDDNANHCALIEQELLDEGYRVATARNFPDARRYLARKRPDLVVTDIGIRGSSGLELLPDLAALDQSIPFILYSGYAAYQSEILSWAGGAFVLKSGDLTELKTTINRLLVEKGCALELQSEVATSM